MLSIRCPYLVIVMVLSPAKYTRKYSVNFAHAWVSEAKGVDALAMRSMVDDAISISLVKESRDLEGFNGTKFTDEILKYEIVNNLGVVRN